MLLGIDLRAIGMRDGRKDIDTLWSEARGFANALAPEVRTLWVTDAACEFRAFGRKATRDPFELWRISQYYDLAGCRIAPGEGVFNKEGGSAFAKNNLHKHLKAEYPGTSAVIVMGGYTERCVASTVYDALRLGYKCHVATDLLFEQTRNDAVEMNLWNETLLRSHLRQKFERDGLSSEDGMKNLFCDSAEKIIELFKPGSPGPDSSLAKEKPALPQGQTPVPFNPQPVG
ncbi:MAG: isochorismatase family protein [Alphaproteobacteria bacterium]|nr:isochorismatase family protein [Alphaproteobacteria bacterium]